MAQTDKKENGVIEEVITQAVKDGNTTITILTGNAPEQPKLHSPKPVDIKGTIDAPSRFTEIRVYDQKKSHCLVSVSDGTIKLTVDEQETNNKFTIEGKVILGKEFVDLGINQGKIYTPADLAKKLRLKRSIFPTKEDHTNILVTLKNVKGKVNTEIEKSSQDNGSRSEIFRQVVESNIPEAVTVMLPVIEGQAPVRMDLNVILEVDGGDFYCILESIDGAEKIDEYKEKVINEEVAKLKDRTTIIYV